MALDQQRNWDISMAENLQKTLLQGRERKRNGVSEDNGTSQLQVVKLWTGPPIHLPDEIIVHVLDYTSEQPGSQSTLAACCSLSSQWYEAAVPYLYARPQLYGKNFDLFTRTICPSLNLHVRKSRLAGLVRELDLGRLVHQGSKSMTARLLGRTKGSLESFRAPQASFAINCLSALARCSRLRALDLSLVSESLPLPDLLRSVVNLETLQTFRLPRSSGFGNQDGRVPLQWPVRLQELALSGGIDAWFLTGNAQFPDTLRSLTIEHCPLAKSSLVLGFLVGSIRKLPCLERLKISNMPRFDAYAMDDLLYILPNLRHLSISVDYVSPAVFDEGSSRKYVLEEALLLEGITSMPTLRHTKLESLELTNSGNPSVEDKITPIDVLIAVDDDILPALRVVRVAKSLFWQSGDTARDAEALADALQARAATDWEHRHEAVQPPSAIRPAGVWTFEG